MRRFNIFFFFVFCFSFFICGKTNWNFPRCFIFSVTKSLMCYNKTAVQLKHLKKKSLLPLFEEIVMTNNNNRTSTEKLSQGILMQENCYAPENLLMQMFLSFFFFFILKQFMCPSLFC